MNFKITYLIAASLFFTTAVHAQVDTIFTNNEKIACNVKEVTADAVKYVYPNEEVINTVYKNTIYKIAFKSGRVQTFAEQTNFKELKSVEDFDMIAIAHVEAETNGLFKLDAVSAKAKGTTVYSSMTRVKERAYKKLKICGAMNGANLIYLTQNLTEGNRYGGQYSAGSSTETNVAGVAYSNKLPNAKKFETLTAGQKIFAANVMYKLGDSDPDYTKSQTNAALEIQEVLNEGGLIYLVGKLEGEKTTKFRVAYLTDNSFSIVFKTKSAIYSYSFNVEPI